MYKAYICGWFVILGDQESEFLLKATIYIIDDNICRNQYKNSNELRKGFDERTMVCAGHLTENKDTCKVRLCSTYCSSPHDIMDLDCIVLW